DALNSQRRHRLLNRIHGRVRQLPGRSRITQLVRPFAVEANRAPPHVEARAHAVGAFWGTRYLDRGFKWNPSDARERILDDLPLQDQLSGIVDEGVKTPAAGRIARRFTAIGGRLEHVSGFREGDALVGAGHA